MQLTNISYGDEPFDTGFRVFVDMNEQRFRSTFTPNHVVKLTETLYLSNANIFVSNGSVLGNPDSALLIPGIVNINGERIIYYEKEGNRLSRLRRGAGGTGVAAVHLAGSDVEDVGPNRYNNSGQYIPSTQYRVYPTTKSVDEGNTIRFQIETENVLPGTTLYWTNEGSSSLTDFLGSVNNGSFITGGSFTDGETSVYLTPVMDLATEGNESIIFTVRTGSISGPIVAVAETVTINDISLLPSYEITPRAVSIGEGSSIVYDVKTRGVANGTTLYWTNSGSTQPSDFTVQVNSGSFLIGGDYRDGFGFIKLDTVRIPGANANKSIIINLRTGSVTGPIQKTANVVYVTNVPDPAYYLTAQRTAYGAGVGVNSLLTANEGDAVNFGLFTYGLKANTSLFYHVTGNVSTSDYTDSVTFGELKLQGDEFGASANVIISITEDVTTEGYENLIFNVYNTKVFDANTFVIGPITIDIKDTSKAPSVIVTPSSSSINEDGAVTFSIATEGINPGATLYWKNLGTTNSSDFSNFPVTTQVTVSGSYDVGSASVSLLLSEDWSPNLNTDPGAVEEGPETIIFAVYLTDPNGTPTPAPISTPVTVTVGDTSKATTTTTTTLSPAATPPPGAALVNFFNGDFEVLSSITTDSDEVDHIPGWSVYKPGVGTTPAHLRLNGFSNILGWPTPTDPTPEYGNTPKPYGDQDPGSMSYGFNIVEGQAGSFGGTSVIRLYSSGTSVSYGIVRGPYLVADNPIVCAAGDKVFFHWKAEAGSDDFDVFAYLLDTSNGNTILLLNTSSYEYGSTTTPWVRVEREISSGETGTYRFIFVCGSMDASGGTALGASLYLDNIDKISASAPSFPWTILVEEPTTKVSGSMFVFNWTAPAGAVGSNYSYWIVNPGTTTAFPNFPGINLGAIGNLPANSTTGSFSIQTSEISGSAQVFQVIITSGTINDPVLGRSPTCTIAPS